MEIKIEFTGNSLSQVRDKAIFLNGKLLQQSNMWDQVSVYLDRWVQKNFLSSGGNVGGWEPFKYGGRLTTKDKGNAKSIDGHHWINTSAKLLMDTGALRLSYLPFTMLGAKGAGVRSELPYAYPQNYGTDVLPSRRMVPIDTDMEVMDNIHQIMDDWLRVTINEAAL